MTKEEFMNKKIAVVGIGGVGGYLAAMLLREFPNVTLCARGARAEQLKEKGLIMHSDYNGDSVSPVSNVVNVADLQPQDYIFICVKNYSLEEICQQIQGAITEDTVIIPVMNGADPGPRTRSYLQKGTVLDTVIYIVSFLNEAYEVIQQGQYAYLRMGIENPDQREQEKIGQVAELFDLCQIDYKVSEDIQADIWRKFIFNCAYNVITAFYDNNVGQLRADERKAFEFESLIQEAYRLAVAKEINITQADIDHMIWRFHEELAEGATSSLQRDRNAGKTVEVDTFGGYIVKESAKFGLEAPVSLRMYEEMKN